MSALDQAIACLLNPSSPAEVKTQAFDYISAVKKEPGFVEYAMRKSLEMDATQNLSVCFFYLQAIEELLDRDYSQYTETQRSHMHNYLTLITSPQCALLSTHSSLLTKLAVIYAKVISIDFPEMWPLAFSQLMQGTQNYVGKKFFLMVMKVANEDLLDAREEVVLPLARKLKEEMRKRVIGDATQLWKVYLSEDSPEIANMTLGVLADYIDWIPLEVALEFLPFMHLNPPQSLLPSLKCLTSLVNKGMDPSKKLDLLTNLNLIPALEALHVENMSFDESEEPAAVATLVNAVGMQLMEIGPCELLDPTVKFALVLLASKDLSVSHIILDFLTEYIHSLKVKSLSLPVHSLSSIERSHIQQICLLVMRKCEMPGRFTCKEDEEQFEGYRKELAQVFKSLVGVESMLESVLEVVISTVQELCLSLPQSRPQSLEVVLFLLYHFAECVPDIHKKLSSDNHFSRLIGFVLRSGIKEIPEKMVIRQYLEVCVRYSGYFEGGGREEELGSVINPMILHSTSPDPDLSKHSIYMLYRLVLKLPKGILPQAPLLLTHLLSLFSRIFDDQSSLYLAKSFGLLLANRYLPVTIQQNMLLAYVQSISPPLNTYKIGLIAEIVGGFQRVAPKELWEVLGRLGEVIRMEVGGGMEAERYKAVVYFYQKLLVALEDGCSELIRLVLLQLYSAVSLDTLEDLLKVTPTQLIAHTSQVIKTGLETALSREVIQGIINGVISTIPCPNTSLSAEAMQLIDLRKTWLRLLGQLCSKGLDLFSVSDGLSLVEYITNICENKYEVSVSVTQSIKSALELLHRLLSHLLAHDSPSLPSLLPYSPRLTKSLFSLGLNPKTLEAASILQELLHIHLLTLQIATRLGVHEPFNSVMTEVTSIQYWRKICEITQNIVQVDVPQLRAMLLALLPAK